MSYTSAYTTTPLAGQLQTTAPYKKRQFQGGEEEEERPLHVVKRVSSFNETLSRFYPMFQDTSECCANFDKLRISSDSTPEAVGEPHKIFQIPEILSKILEFVERDTVIPQEVSPIRRKPTNLKHALLIYGNMRDAKRAMEAPETPRQPSKLSGDLYSCLQVNKMWNRVAMEMLHRRLVFTKDEHFNSYFASRVNKTKLAVHTEAFVCNKLKHVKQSQLDFIAETTTMKNLKWVEFYICPYLLPPQQLFTNGDVTKLVVPCSKTVDDNFLKMVSVNCPNLETLDIRACELVTDAGIYSIALNCPKLHTLNVGRHSRGELITDASISAVCRYTNIKTLGLAGCHVTDNTIWELLEYRNDKLERLSLNNCYKLTNLGIPQVFDTEDEAVLFPRLNVIELRGCVNITDFTSLVSYKKFTQTSGNHIPLLVEGCEIVDRRIKEVELKLDLEISSRMFKDLQEWANDAEDDDKPYNHLIKRAVFSN